MDIDRIMIDEDHTIIEAMKQLDSVATRVLFVRREGRLTASLSDGDIRRWILSNGDLNAPVSKAANYEPKYLYENQRQYAKEYMMKYGIEAVPIVYDDYRVHSVILRNKADIIADAEKIHLPVVMMAGGLGTRLYPYTKILPKPLIPVGDIPIAEHIINQFRKYGCKEFYLVVNHKKNMIKAYFNEIEKDYEIHYVDEEKQLGTGGGLSLLKGKLHTTFLLSNCDILIHEDFAKIFKLHKESGNMVTMICSLKNFTVPYGVVEIGEDGSIAGMREKPELSFFTNTGCYIVEPEVIEMIPDGVPVGFPDIIMECKKRGEKVGVYPIGEKSWSDMGQLDELEHMKQQMEMTDKNEGDWASDIMNN